MPQEEKERIVDNLCIYAIEKAEGGLWSDGTRSRYQEVAKGCAYMDAVVGKQPETNLVDSVRQFLQNREVARTLHLNACNLNKSRV